MAFSPGGATVYVTGGTNRNQLFVFGRAGGTAKALATLSVPLYDLTFDASGQLWATTGGGPLVQLDPTTGQIIASYGDEMELGLAANGNLLYGLKDTPQTQIFDPRVAWLISDILSDDNARLTGFGRNSTLKIERPAAVKTGTTTNFHDNWTVGYTPSLVVGVWVGNSDYQAMRDVNGLTGAAPIWQETIRGILKGKAVETFTRPAGMVEQAVCTYSGLLPTALCEKSGREWFIDGTQPIRNDTIYRQIWLDSATGILADEQTPSERRQPLTVLDLPVQAQRWAHSQGLKLLSDYQGLTTVAQSMQAEPGAGFGLEFPTRTGVLSGAHEPTTNGSNCELISPETGTNYTISPKLELSAQQLPVEALVGEGYREVSLWVDGFEFSEFRSPPYVIWWQLIPGTHRFQVQALDTNGQVVKSNTVEIVVTK